jgi:hypothetical protein
MKKRVKVEAPKMCPNCKANLETTRTDAFGAKSKTHYYEIEECLVCREYKGKGRLVPKTGTKTNPDGTGSFTGKLVGMGF